MIKAICQPCLSVALCVVCFLDFIKEVNIAYCARPRRKRLGSLYKFYIYLNNNINNKLLLINTSVSYFQIEAPPFPPFKQNQIVFETN